ncbi:MAG: efflux RND transporter periplasmic adaptor subunit [Chthoniobacteraceae bacterium]
MKARAIFIIVAIALAAVLGWQFGLRQHTHSDTTAASDRKVLFYQSPMHPWIKSDKPGNCTICGMKLVPVLEGDADTSGGDAVKLGPQSISVVGIETAAVTRQPLRRTIHVAGTIEDDDSAHRRLSAYVEGRIDKLFVNYVGAEVTAGQPLASFYSRDLLVARSEYAEALKRSPSPERESILKASQQKLRRMGLLPEQIEKLAGTTGDTIDIVAPSSGTIVERKVYPGQYVKEGDVLFEIGDFSKMWFVFDAYERDLAWIRVGQPVEITTSSVPGKIFTAPITFIDPNLVMDTRSAKVRVILENPSLQDAAMHRRELLHKVFAEGRIKVEGEPVLTVARNAVLSPGGLPVVYVLKGERDYEPRHVTLGRAGDDVWEVLAGLQEGERVVTTGNLLIDAQAQLDHPQQTPALPVAMSPERLDAQQASALLLLEKLSAVSDALSSDDLAAHNAGIAALHTVAMSTAEELGEPGKRLSEVAHVGPAKTLAEARKQFYPLATAVAGLALQWKKQLPAIAGRVKVFECPMAKSAVPSADTNQGRWVQMQLPLRNPYFGAEMLDCGKEIQP